MIGTTLINSVPSRKSFLPKLPTYDNTLYAFLISSLTNFPDREPLTSRPVRLILFANIAVCICEFSEMIAISKTKDPPEKLSMKYLRIPLLVLNFFGLWKNDNNSRFLYGVYGFCIIIFSQYLYAGFQIMYMVVTFGDVQKIAEASYLLLTQVTLCFKIIMLVLKKRKIIAAVQFTDAEVFIPKKAVHKQMVDNSVFVQKFEYFLFQFLAIITITMWVIFPLLDVKDNKKVLPLKAWYPVNKEETPYYEIIYCYQLIGIWFSALINISIDRLTTAMIANGCAQVEILMDNLENIKKYATQAVMEKKYLKLRKSNADTIRSEINRQIIVELNQCIYHHQNIFRYIKDIEECFQTGILVQFAASVGIICVTCLLITLTNPASFEFASNMLYFAVMVSQILFICRIGDSITSKSESIQTAAYFSTWYEFEKGYKTTLIIFMEILKKPIVTRAGIFFPLSLQTFASILKSSYSYFTVLQQLNKK